MAWQPPILWPLALQIIFRPTAAMKTYELRRGQKIIRGTQEAPDVVCFTTGCAVYPECVVEVRMTLAQAEELTGERRRNIPSLLPEVPAPLREIFLSGTTPAEWDEIFGNGVKQLAEYPGYRVYKS